MAVGALRELGRAGLKVPKDFSVIGLRRYLARRADRPQLTTIMIPERNRDCRRRGCITKQILPSRPGDQNLHSAGDSAIYLCSPALEVTSQRAALGTVLEGLSAGSKFVAEGRPDSLRNPSDFHYSWTKSLEISY